MELLIKATNALPQDRRCSIYSELLANWVLPSLILNKSLGEENLSNNIVFTKLAHSWDKLWS